MASKKEKKFNCGDTVQIKCPRCKCKEMKLSGIKHNDGKVELECSVFENSCLYSEWIPIFEKIEDIKLNYTKPKTKDEIASEKLESKSTKITRRKK